MDIANIKAQIAAVLARYPDLAEDAELRADMLEGCTNIDEVLQTLVVADAEAEMVAISIKNYIADLKSRMNRYNMRSEAARDALMSVMEAADLQKFTLPIATISIRETPPKLIEIDADITPPEYTQVVIEPMKSEIKSALENGLDVPGWQLSNGGRSVTIRTK